jgi:hypothetical protein
MDRDQRRSVMCAWDDRSSEPGCHTRRSAFCHGSIAHAKVRQLGRTYDGLTVRAQLQENLRQFLRGQVFLDVKKKAVTFPQLVKFAYRDFGEEAPSFVAAICERHWVCGKGLLAEKQDWHKGRKGARGAGGVPPIHSQTSTLSKRRGIRFRGLTFRVCFTQVSSLRTRPSGRRFGVSEPLTSGRGSRSRSPPRRRCRRCALVSLRNGPRRVGRFALHG